MTYYDVVKKLLGPIMPVGDSREDERRYLNLEETITLVDKLLFDIRDVSGDAVAVEHSRAKAGKRAKLFLENTKADQ